MHLLCFTGKAIICSQEQQPVSPRGYECDSDTNSGISNLHPQKSFNSSCQQCMVERAACKMSSTNLTTLGIASPESSFAESSISSSAMSPTPPNIITRTIHRAPPAHQPILKTGGTLTKKPYVAPVPTVTTHQASSADLGSGLSNVGGIPMTNNTLHHQSPRNME